MRPDGKPGEKGAKPGAKRAESGVKAVVGARRDVKRVGIVATSEATGGPIGGTSAATVEPTAESFDASDALIAATLFAMAIAASSAATVAPIVGSSREIAERTVGSFGASAVRIAASSGAIALTGANSVETAESSGGKCAGIVANFAESCAEIAGSIAATVVSIDAGRVLVLTTTIAGAKGIAGAARS